MSSHFLRHKIFLNCKLPLQLNIFNFIYKYILYIFIYSAVNYRAQVTMLLCCVFSQTSISDAGFGEILQQMGVKDGEDISFSHFWNLIQTLASNQHGLLSHEKVSKCGCVLLWDLDQWVRGFSLQHRELPPQCLLSSDMF